MGGLTKEEMTLGGNCGGGILGEFDPFGPERLAMIAIGGMIHGSFITGTGVLGMAN